MLYFGRDSTFTNRLGLPLISQRSTNSLPKQQSAFKQPQSLQKRINDLEGSLKMIEKKYKNNLKQGFDNKIKSFRLQAVIERKLIQKSISDTKNSIELEELKQKNDRAQRMKNQELRRLDYIAERKRIDQERIHFKKQHEKKQLQQRLKEDSLTLQASNREIHDKIQQQQRNKGKKKEYFIRIRQNRKYKQTSQQKQNYLRRIMQNEQQLKTLRTTAAQLQQKMQNFKNHDNTFLTI